MVFFLFIVFILHLMCNRIWVGTKVDLFNKTLKSLGGLPTQVNGSHSVSRLWWWKEKRQKTLSIKIMVMEREMSEDILTKASHKLNQWASMLCIPVTKPCKLQHWHWTRMGRNVKNTLWEIRWCCKNCHCRFGFDWVINFNEQRHLVLCSVTCDWNCQDYFQLSIF